MFRLESHFWPAWRLHPLLVVSGLRIITFWCLKDTCFTSFSRLRSAFEKTTYFTILSRPCVACASGANRPEGRFSQTHSSFFRSEREAAHFFRPTKVLISKQNTMVFAIRLGSRGSLRRTRKIRAFGPPKNILGPVFSSQNIIKHVSFVGHEAEKCRLLRCFSIRKVPIFRFSFGKCTCFTCFSRLSLAVAKITYFTHIWNLSSAFAKSAFLAKNYLSRKLRILRYFHFGHLWGTSFSCFLQNCRQK